MNFNAIQRAKKRAYAMATITGRSHIKTMKISEKLYIGDVVEMRKPHPCGGTQWKIDRVGADIGLVCQTCGRRVLLSRRKFARGTKGFVARGADGNE